MIPMSDLAIFNDLPYVPLLEICKHLDPHHFIMCPLRSGNWKSAVRKQVAAHYSNIYLFLNSTSTNVHVGVVFPNDPNKSVCVDYFQSNNAEDNTDYKLVRRCLNQKPNSTKIYFFRSNSKGFENFETVYLEMVELLCTLFKPEETVMNLNTDEFSFDALNRLLLTVPQATAMRMFNNGIDGRDKVTLKGETVKKVMERLKSSSTFQLVGMMDHVFRSEMIHFDVQYLTLNDSRFLTCHNLMNISFKYGSFGVNTLTTQDFNLYLTRWKNYKIRKTTNSLITARFLINENQKLNVKAILKGLDAKPWEYNTRARSQYCIIGGAKHAIDMRDGFDIQNVNGKLGTVLLTTNYLYFIAAEDPFEIRKEKQISFNRVVEERGHLVSLLILQGILRRAQASGLVVEPNLLQDYEQQVNACEQRIATKQAVCNQLQLLD